MSVYQSQIFGCQWLWTSEAIDEKKKITLHPVHAKLKTTTTTMTMTEFYVRSRFASLANASTTTTTMTSPNIIIINAQSTYAHLTTAIKNEDTPTLNRTKWNKKMTGEKRSRFRVQRNQQRKRQFRFDWRRASQHKSTVVLSLDVHRNFYCELLLVCAS